MNRVEQVYRLIVGDVELYCWLNELHYPFPNLSFRKTPICIFNT